MVRELEEAAAVAAAALSETTTAAKQKIIQGAAGAKAFVSSLWSAFDSNTSTSQSLASSQSEAELRQRLGLDEDEAILEVFRCKLIQQYAAVKNDFTPPKNIAFSGQLHVAARHIAFELDAAMGSGDPAISLAASEVVSVVREGDALRVGLSRGREMCVGAFSLPKLEVESAFALLSGLCSSKEQRGEGGIDGGGTGSGAEKK